MNSNITHKLLNTLTTAIFYLAILFFIIGFNFTDRMAGNWYQQFFPSNGNRPITDVKFIDSLTGYAVQSQDSSFILKTTNSGDSWTIIYKQLFAMTHLQFFDSNTGYAGGGYLYKTTNGGFNWTQINTPSTSVEKMYVLNHDTIWFVSSNGLTGGVFRTTDSGASWQQQYYQFNQNPDRIYMYDRNFGFFSKTNMSSLYRTTNSGMNWTQITGETGFNDIHFVDSQTGWKASGFIKKTTNGGLNWLQQIIPSGGIISGSAIGDIYALDHDTVWGVGGTVEYPNLQTRGIIYRTTNGGQNWLFQIPDTAINNITYYSFIQFINQKTGWAYTRINTIGGVHTINGGDTTWIVGVKQIGNEIANEFKLFQNYPNPFNPVTNIKYKIANNKSNVKLVIYDITGREVVTLVNQQQNAGIYEAEFNGYSYSSGIYLYSLIIEGGLADTKKMMLVK